LSYPRPARGTRALCRGQQSSLTPYTVESAEPGKTPPLLAGCRVYTTAKRTRPHARKAQWMTFILVRLTLSPQQARQLYRPRVGIETGYRCARPARGWTTSNHPLYRFRLMALSLWLLNGWLHLRLLVARLPQGDNLSSIPPIFNSGALSSSSYAHLNNDMVAFTSYLLYHQILWN
jgi:hypothetical protein